MRKSLKDCGSRSLTHMHKARSIHYHTHAHAYTQTYQTCTHTTHTSQCSNWIRLWLLNTTHTRAHTQTQPAPTHTPFHFSLSHSCMQLGIGFLCWVFFNAKLIYVSITLVWFLIYLERINARIQRNTHQTHTHASHWLKKLRLYDYHTYLHTRHTQLNT